MSKKLFLLFFSAFLVLAVILIGNLVSLGVI
jgi:hypothetical protein